MLEAQLETRDGERPPRACDLRTGAHRFSARPPIECSPASTLCGHQPADGAISSSPAKCIFTPIAFCPAPGSRGRRTSSSTIVLRSRDESTKALEREQGIIVRHVFHRHGEPIREFPYDLWHAAVAKGKIPGHRIVHDFRRPAARSYRRSGCQRRRGHEDLRPQDTEHLREVQHRERGRPPRSSRVREPNGASWDTSSKNDDARARDEGKKSVKSAEGVGFEPTRVVSPAGFQDRCLQPLGHPSIVEYREFTRFWRPKSSASETILRPNLIGTELSSSERNSVISVADGKSAGLFRARCTR